MNGPQQEQAARRPSRQFLISASDSLYHHEQECAARGVPFPAELRQAWDTIRAELARWEPGVDEKPGGQQ